MDYKDGTLNGLLSNSKKLEKLIFEDKVKVNVPEDSILIMQSIVPFTIRDELIINVNTKIFLLQ